MDAGRPTKYNDEILEKANHYIANHQKYGDPVPTVEGLACELDVSRSTVYLWGEAHAGFSDILKRLMTHQGRKLLAGGLTGEFNAPFAKMMATKHGYSDRIEQDISSSDGTMRPTVIEVVGVKPSE